LSDVYETLPQNLTNDQAIELTEMTIARLEDSMSKHNYKAAMRTCLRALGGLVRYRLVEQQFLTNNEEPGKSAHQVVRNIIERSSDIPERRGVKLLAEDVLTVLEERGVPDTILQWDVDESDDDG